METDFIELARRGDRNAMEYLVLSHQEHVFRVAVGILKNEEDANDIVQDVWVVLLEQLPNFRGESQLGTWLHRITVNACLMCLRKQRRRTRYEGPMLDVIELSAPIVAHDETIDTSRRLTVVRSVWPELPEIHREILQRRGVEGATLHEISEELGLSLAATKSRIFRARRHLHARVCATL